MGTPEVTMRATVLIVAAGAGTRLQAGMPKALVTLGDGRTMLEHCLDSVAAAALQTAGPGAPQVTGIAVVVPSEPDAASALKDVCHAFALRTGLTVQAVPGGSERADSVRAGLAAVRELAGETADRHAVLVQDAARPFVPPAVFRTVWAALESGAAAVVPGLPVVDTIKSVELVPSTGTAVPERVTGTPSRSELRAVQTPQGFDLDALEAAHRDAAATVGDHATLLTDDAMAMEAAGHEVVVVPGDPLGFKITTRLDLLLADSLVKSNRPEESSR
ncbi:2-C-methyl-D-erythritol 4-phosphate cytidylyltransferase [Citricoccus sp. GCM10030269]|uniref:IspD/TarI family cytidylyltransferase n=1 Tax=Citricoccus sp. GCM10030269 TaxID=3273388 RepID=UPI00361BEF1F